MNEQYRQRQREVAVAMLMAQITIKLGTDLTKNVNQFRRKLRHFINTTQRNEESLYKESLALADRAWNKAFSERSEGKNDLSVASTLSSLYLLVDDCTWFRKKITTPKQFETVYLSIANDRDEPLTHDIEIASDEFINTISEALGFDLPTNTKLKRMILIMRQNKEL